MPVAAIARAVSVSRETVYQVPDRPEVQGAVTDVREELRRFRGQFVRDWLRASEVAAQTGDHRPAEHKRALLAIQEIGLPHPTQAVQVNIGFKMHGLPEPGQERPGGQGHR